MAFPLAFSLYTACFENTQNENQTTNETQQGHFTDITTKSKLDFTHNPGVDGSYFMPESIGAGAAFLDYDNDGDLDIYLINGAWRDAEHAQFPPLQNQLFRQETDGTFVNVTAESGLGDTGYGMGVAVGDIDNDGDLDVYISNYGPDALYRNNGDGTFSNITQQAGIDNPHWGCSTIFFDYDRDGLLDIFVSNYIEYDPKAECTDHAGRLDYCGPTNFPGVPDILFKNNGDGSFTDVSQASGIGSVESVSLGVVSADFNGDTWPDLYVANDGRENQLWLNQQDGTFKDFAKALGAAVNNVGRKEAGMGIAIGDIDGDLDFDLFMTHLRTETNTLYKNDNNALFLDETTPAGLAGPSLPYTGFGTGFFDFDHDGDLDLAVVNGRVTRGPLLTIRQPAQYWDDYAEPNLLFENTGYGQFQDISHLAPTFCKENLENSRGLAFGDVDNDGDLDLLIANEGGIARLFRNDASKNGHWLLVRTILPDNQRDAIGAVVTVYIQNKSLRRIVSPGYSYLSSNDFRAHFGLGDVSAVEKIVVLWPNGDEETFAGVSADQFITLAKGQSILQHE